jgi:Cysteine rich repeat
MSKTILAALAILLVTSAAQAQTRTAVKACGKEIETHCGDVQAGGGAVRDCIKTHLKEFSPGCQAAFTRVATAAKACATDTKQNCAGVKPGGSRIEVCLKAHFNALSADCKAALSGTAAGHT